MPELDLYEQKVLLKYMYNAPRSFSEMYGSIKNIIEKISDKECDKLIEFTREKPWNTENARELKEILSNLIKKYSHIEKSNTQKIIDVIAQIFDMDETEKEIFSIFTRNELFYAYLNNDRNMNRYLYRQIPNKSTVVISRAKKRLRRNCLDIEYDLPEHLESLFFKNFDDINLMTVSEYLLGNKCHTKFKASDFKHLEKEYAMCVKIIKNAIKNRTKGVNILLYGVPGAGKTEFAKSIVQSAGKLLYEIPYINYDDEDMTTYQRLVALKTNLNITRKNKDMVLLYDEADNITNYNFKEESNAPSKILVNNVTENVSTPVIWTLNNIRNIDDAFLRRMTYAVKFNKLNENTQIKIWQKELKRNNITVPRNKIIELSSKYDVSLSVIKNAVDTTKLIKGNAENFECFIDSISTAMNYGYHIERENKNKYKNIDFIYNDKLVNSDIDLKFLTEKLKQTKKMNFSICMYGEPGTGKSEYAKYLAHRLGLKIVQKKASDIFGKFVGETEENIALSFKEAKNKKAMLIIDEADSFLQSRKNAKNNWEVSFVNEMLTQMENFDYPFVCTTNLMDTLDEASLRRFTFKIKFDFLTSQQIRIAFAHFFKQKISENACNINGLTVGDFVTVKKKLEFLGINNSNDILDLLIQEVKFKNTDSLKNTIGFN